MTRPAEAAHDKDERTARERWFLEMLKLLIADDARDVADVIAFGARMTWPECQVAIAASGDEALHLFEEVLPDLVVLDVAMPGATVETCGKSLPARAREGERSDVTSLLHLPTCPVAAGQSAEFATLGGAGTVWQHADLPALLAICDHSRRL